MMKLRRFEIRRLRKRGTWGAPIHNWVWWIGTNQCLRLIWQHCRMMISLKGFNDPKMNTKPKLNRWIALSENFNVRRWWRKGPNWIPNSLKTKTFWTKWKLSPMNLKPLQADLDLRFCTLIRMLKNLVKTIWVANLIYLNTLKLTTISMLKRDLKVLESKNSQIILNLQQVNSNLGELGNQNWNLIELELLLKPHNFHLAKIRI